MPADDGFGMPFRWIVRAREIDGALAMAGSAYRSRIFDPHTTIWAWMAQTISQDRSCRHAVAQVVAHHAVRDRQVSARTGAYVQARQRLDIEVIQYLARSLGRRLEDQNAYPTPLDRPLIACDGTTVSSPDSPSIVKRYPKMRADYGADGLGFPTIRVLYLTSLATGAVMDMQIAPYRGKGTHEIPLLKRSLVNLREGDVIVGDRAYCARLLFSYLPQHGFDLVTRMLSSMRLENLRVISVHGKRDHVYRMRRPAPQHMPPWMTAIDARRTPSSFDCRVTAVGATIRNQKRLIELATTLTDPKVSKRTIEDIYRLRWDVETDIRSLKVDLGARILRCQSAEMIEKELWMTALAHNGVRGLMAEAAKRRQVEPRSLSFKGATQAINAFGSELVRSRGDDRQRLYDRMLDAIASHTVRDRPGRVEPRAKKRRDTGAVWLTQSREQARRRRPLI